MPEYMNTVICAAALSGIILLLVFYRLKVFDFRTAAAVTLASLVTALVMPGVLNLIYSSGTKSQDPIMEALFVLISIVVYIALVLLFSAAIVFLLPKLRIGRKTEAAAEDITAETVTEAAAGAAETAAEAKTIAAAEQENGEAAAETAAAAVPSAQDTVQPEIAEGSPLQGSMQQGDAAESETVQVNTLFEQEYGEASFGANIMDGESDMKKGNSFGDNYIEDIYLKYVGRNDEISETTADNEENERFDGDAVENSVDSNEIIDKMGIENNIQDGGSMTIEECIDEAYRLKVAGDAEGAVLYYMYALDKKPQKDLTFWIILDICVLYKSLGQQDLAMDILNGYYDIYGDEMDSSIKEEIIRNLTGMEA